MSIDKSAHYDDAYFAWQKKVGTFGGWANVTTFEEYVRPEDTVLDFGCGGGFLLSNLVCARRVGVEINPAAMEMARENGVEVTNDMETIADNSIDLIISNHALEHALDPLSVLRTLRSKLKDDGRIVFVVPCESYRTSWTPDDMHHHIFTWSPLNLGNLFKEAGYQVRESKAFFSKWPPKYRLIARIGGRRLFRIASVTYGFLSRKIVQVRIVASR